MSRITQYQQEILKLVARGDAEALRTFLKDKPGDLDFVVRWDEFRLPGFLSDDGFDSVTPLGAATYWGYLETIDVLLGHGADPNGYDGELSQATPLYNAVATSNKRAIYLLLSQPDIDVDRTHYANLTPFLLACSKGDFTLISMLLRAGALIEQRTDAGESAVEMLVLSEVQEMEELDVIALVQYLVDAGAPLDWHNENEDIIEVAAQEGYKILKTYLQSIAR